MNRLTTRINVDSKEYVYYNDKGNPILPTEILDTPKVREVLKKLAKYEDTGLTPEEIEELKQKVQDLENEIYFMVNGSP